MSPPSSTPCPFVPSDSEPPRRDNNIWRGVDLQSHRPAAVPRPRENLPAWKWKALLVSNCFLTIMHGYDVSNVANIQTSVYKAFGHIELLSWIALSYSVCSIAFTPLGRKLFKFGDFRVLYLCSMVFIIAGAALSGAAPNIECVIAGRAVMAIGASVIYQGILSFNTLFTYPHELGLVQGTIGACFAIGLFLGPIIGGVFAHNEHTTWRWAFYLVIPLCIMSLILQALFCPRYRVSTDKSVWTHIKELDWVGNVLHAGTCLLFAMGCTYLGSATTWGTGPSIAAYILFTFLTITYVIQQAYSISTTPENRLLSPASLLSNRTMLLAWICTFCAAASYGCTLYYVPIYFAFRYGLDPLAVAVRLLAFVGVFVFTIMLCSGLLTAVRYYKPFFLTGSALILIGGGLFQTLTVNTPESAIMGFEALIAAGLRILWHLALIVCNTFLQDTEERLDLACLTNMAQIGGIAASLAISGMVYQSVGYQSLRDSVSGLGLSDRDIHELLSGVESPILKDPEVLRLAIDAITSAVKGCFSILLATGTLSFLSALYMKWEVLELKKPTVEPRDDWVRHQRSDRRLLLDDLVILNRTAGGESGLHPSAHVNGSR
ncbi:MFS general substrate transporter [Hypomontagnella monticulosa]|nr:MFS general substrate transporter [Hypomontagnella monticulosa]